MPCRVRSSGWDRNQASRSGGAARNIGVWNGKLRENPDLVTSAVSEIVRWQTPVIHMRRTITRDGVALESGTHTFNAGEKVVVWYPAANRDPAVFADPEVFDIARTPNNHIAFGGPGPHFCLGAHLARLELDVAFKMLFDRYPDIAAVGDPVMLRSNFVNGIKHLTASYTP